jgi:hypothetical protein
MPSSVDEQPPGRPERPRPQPGRGRSPSRARAGASRRRSRPAPAGRETAPEAGTPAPDPRGWRRSPTRLVVVLSVLTAAVVGLAVFGVVLGTRSPKKPPAPARDDTPVPVTSYRDAQTGFTVEYPRSWQKVELPVADYRLALDGGSNVAFTIRVLPIETPATAANLENFKAVTDGLVTSNNTVHVLKQQAVSLNGMLGYYYFYTFTDGGVQAVHAHYFLFSGNKMNILVFQALPDDFARMAPTFDKIAESFRSNPDTPAGAVAVPASTTSTTAP